MATAISKEAFIQACNSKKRQEELQRELEREEQRRRERAKAERERERRLRLHRERQEAERREQERLQREREERNEQGVLYLSRGSDNTSQICNESTVKYVAKYKPPFARGVQIRGVRVSGNVDSFKIIRATGDAKAFVGKRIVIDDDNELRSINNCTRPSKPKPIRTPKPPNIGGIDIDIPLFDLGGGIRGNMF